MPYFLFSANFSFGFYHREGTFSVLYCTGKATCTLSSVRFTGTYMSSVRYTYTIDWLNKEVGIVANCLSFKVSSVILSSSLAGHWQYASCDVLQSGAGPARVHSDPASVPRPLGLLLQQWQQWSLCYVTVRGVGFSTYDWHPFTVPFCSIWW